MGDRRNEDNGGEIVDRKPVVSRRDALPILESAEHALDDVSASVCCAVERVDDGTGGAARNDGFDAFVLKPSAQAISVIGLSAMSRLAGANASSIGKAIVMSAMLPGVTATATIRPQPSARQWILVVLPPRETPTAWLNSPLFRLTPNDAP